MSAQQWQPDCTRRQGLGGKTNLKQPWPKLCEIIKKKSFADRGWDQIGFIGSLWEPTHRRTHLDSSYSLNQTAGREYVVQKETTRLMFACACSYASCLQLVSYCNETNCVKNDVSIMVKVNPLMWSSPCLLLWQHGVTQRDSLAHKSHRREVGQILLVNILHYFLWLFLFYLDFVAHGLNANRKCGWMIHLGMFLCNVKHMWHNLNGLDGVNRRCCTITNMYFNIISNK